MLFYWCLRIVWWFYLLLRFVGFGLRFVFGFDRFVCFGLFVIGF